MAARADVAGRRRARSSAATAALARFLFDDPRAALALGGAFFLLSVTGALRLWYLHDEGLYTLDLARTFTREPAAAFFFSKAKPVLLLLYALPARLGVRAFLAAHALVGSAALVLAAAAARRLGVRAPNLAALALATSAEFAVATMSGYPNADGAFFTALALYLYAAERRTVAGLVLGALPFVRNELAPVTIALVAFDGWRRRDARLLVAALAFGAIYLLTGAVYHRDLGWLFHFPDPEGLPAPLRVHRPPTVAEALANLRLGLLASSPLLAVFALGALRPRKPLSMALLASAIAIYGAMTALQLASRLGFDTSPRYYVAPLPLLAVLAPIGLDARARRAPAIAGWIVAGLLGAALVPAGAPGRFAAVVILAAAAWLVARRGETRARCLLALGAVILAVWLLLSTTGRERAQHRETHELVATLRERGIYHDGQPLFSDIYALRYDACSGAESPALLANDAIAWEMQNFLDRASGQLAALGRAAAAEGILLDPNEHVVRRDAVYVLDDQERTRRWRQRIEREGPTILRLERRWVYSWPSATTP